MSEFFIGQIMMAGFSFAPKYFGQCNGQLLPIAQNQALFSLLGTQYGGNGTTTFALPDLRSRTPIGYASSVDPGWQPPAVQIGQTGGVENVTLLQTNIPAHTHAMNASTSPGDNRIPATRVFAGMRSVPGVASHSCVAPAPRVHCDGCMTLATHFSREPAMRKRTRLCPIVIPRAMMASALEPKSPLRTAPRAPAVVEAPGHRIPDSCDASG